MLTRIRDEERGVAMVVALMVVFVVLLLATVVYAQAVHNSTASGYDRKRLQSVDAAEAGLDYFYNYLEQTPAASLTANPFPTPITVGVAPGTATFSITPTWYDANGSVWTGWPASSSAMPSAVKVVSAGTTNGTTSRTMESKITIRPVYGGFKGAVVTNSSISLVNSFNISGNTINDGDVYLTCTTSPCDAVLSSGNQTIRGNLYVPAGSITISTNVHVYGSVWANGSVLQNQPQARIDQDVKSSTSSVTISDGSVGGVGYYCTSVSGTTRIAGGTSHQCQGPPPTPTFPHLTYNDTVYPNADPTWLTGCSLTPKTNCYKVVQFGTAGDTSSAACNSARSYVENTLNGASAPSGYTGTIVRILSKCNYSPSNNVKVSLNQDLGVITNGSVTLGQQSTWCANKSANCTGSASSTTGRALFFDVPWPQSVCSTSSSSSDYHDITVGNNSNFESLISVGLYTPCTAHMSNQNAFYGQVVAGSVDIGNNWQMNYRPVVFPGALVTGFAEDVAYIREVV